MKHTHAHLKAEEIGDARDIVREDKLTKSDNPGSVSPIIEVELSEKLPNLESILQGFKYNTIFKRETMLEKQGKF